ncbi:hypothetical protein TNCV_1929011 [Trichonephila clavipes]|nr:hypothetical protein TNCV_1929011 [Trichonephila clavipes]
MLVGLSRKLPEPLEFKAAQRIRNLWTNVTIEVSSFNCCGTNPTVFWGTPERCTTSQLTGAGSLLPPVYSEAWAKGNAEVSPGHQSSPYGRSVGQKEPNDPQITIFPPYGTPHTAIVWVG